MNSLITKRNKIKFEISNDISLIGRTVEKIASIINRSGSEIDYFVINEILTNAIEHGNKLDKNRKVSIEIFVNEVFYRVVIKDQGKGFNWKRHIDSKIDLQGNSDRGRGITMSKMMCDYLLYNEQGNEVTIINLINKEKDSNFS